MSLPSVQSFRPDFNRLEQSGSQYRWMNMNQSERRAYLIRELLQENSSSRGMQVPAGEEAQERLLRSLMNVRLAAPVSAEFVAVQDAYLQASSCFRTGGPRKSLCGR